MALPLVFALTVAFSPPCDNTCWLAKDGVCDDLASFDERRHFVGCAFWTDCEDCSPYFGVPSPSPLPAGNTAPWTDPLLPSPSPSPTPPVASSTLVHVEANVRLLDVPPRGTSVGYAIASYVASVFERLRDAY